jgi:hypothetical protein
MSEQAPIARLELLDFRQLRQPWEHCLQLAIGKPSNPSVALLFEGKTEHPQNYQIARVLWGYPSRLSRENSLEALHSLQTEIRVCFRGLEWNFPQLLVPW